MPPVTNPHHAVQIPIVEGSVLCLTSLLYCSLTIPTVWGHSLASELATQ